MIVKNCKSVMAEFRESRGQMQEPPKVTPTPPTRNRRSQTPYEGFLKRYEAFEENVDSYGTRDLVYYFRETAERSGQKYVISNIKKDMHIMKVLRENYSNREICGMIEFLYLSDQDYLEKDRLSPNLLASQWVNTIYADMQLWVEDKYVPKSKKTKKKSKGEWHDNTPNEDSSVIGLKF